MRTLRLVIATTVQAPLEQVFAILADVESYPKIFHYMHNLRVLERTNTTVLADVQEDMFGIHIFWVRVRFTFETPKKVTIEQLRGPFEQAIGWFELEPQKNGTTRLVHGAEITASGIVGAMGLLFLTSGEAKRRMTKEVKAIKKAAESRQK